MLFIATLPVPGRVIPNDAKIEGVFNPRANTRSGGPSGREVDLQSPDLPQPRLAPSYNDPSVVLVPAYTDFKLHDITDPADESAKEPLDMNYPNSSHKFVAGNRMFLTRRLWGAANEPPYFHHGMFTTLRQAVLAHAGEALAQRRAFEALSSDAQDAVVEFLKSLQVLPAGTTAFVVDKEFRPKVWPPR